MIVERIKAMLEACEAGTAAFPPTELFNEDWLLRIILDWFSRHRGDRYPISPATRSQVVLAGVAPLGLPDPIPR